MHIMHIMHIMHVMHIMHTTIFWWGLFQNSAWVDSYQSSIIYERRKQAQVLYVIPISSILRRFPVVPEGEKGTIPCDMRRESLDFPGASCDKVRTVAMDVGGGTWTAGPLDGGPSNNGNKQRKTLECDLYSNIQNM